MLCLLEWKVITSQVFNFHALHEALQLSANSCLKVEEKKWWDDLSVSVYAPKSQNNGLTLWPRPEITDMFIRSIIYLENEQDLNA